MKVATVDAGPVGRSAAAAIEAAEGRAWIDLYSAAPTGWAADAGLMAEERDGTVVLQWAATGRRYFTRAIGLGVTGPATESSLDEILGGFEKAGIDMFLLQSLPHCLPAEYEEWLVARGLEPFDAQDRVVRGDGPPVLDDSAGRTDRELKVERVTAATADEWAEFLQSVYRLDTGPWLQRLIGRRGWHQCIAREEGRIVGARGMYIGIDGAAWLGMDGPVPGLTTDDYEPDAAICAHLVAHGIANGARSFLADIEAPSPDLDTPSYRYFGRLGFHRPYVRTHWARLGAFAGYELGEAQGGVDESVDRNEGCECLEPGGVQDRAGEEDAGESDH